VAVSPTDRAIHVLDDVFRPGIDRKLTAARHGLGLGQMDTRRTIIASTLLIHFASPLR
jgi:hypothetical protein